MNEGDTMNEQQKSTKLAKAMGIYYELYSNTCKFFIDSELWLDVYPYGWRLNMTDDEVFEDFFPNLYKPENMALAWRVLNWARECEATVKCVPLSDDTEPFDMPISTAMYDFFYEEWDLTIMTPVDAQGAWLDRILVLTRQAGLT